MKVWISDLKLNLAIFAVLFAVFFSTFGLWTIHIGCPVWMALVGSAGMAFTVWIPCFIGIFLHRG